MDYIKLWEEYIKKKNDLEGKTFSTHLQIRKAIKNPQTHSITLKKITEISLYEGDNYKYKITTLSQLLIEKPRSVRFVVVEKKFNIDKSLNNIRIGRSDETMVEDAQIIIDSDIKIIEDFTHHQEKKISEEVFDYLWKKLEEGSDKLMHDLSLITPSVLRSYAYIDNIEFNEEILRRSHIKLVEIPENINPYEISKMPFIVGDKIIKTDNTKKYLEECKKEWPSNDTYQKLLDLWK